MFTPSKPVYLNDSLAHAICRNRCKLSKKIRIYLRIDSNRKYFIYVKEEDIFLNLMTKKIISKNDVHLFIENITLEEIIEILELRI